MTEEDIEKLPEILKDYICTLKRASLDTTNKQYMCESTIKVVNFDKIPNAYAKGKGWKSVPNSNDALYISFKDTWYFIEFKNGSIDKADLYRKIYDSVIMLLEMNIIPDIEFVRKNIEFILVYNSEKYGKIKPSPARDANFNYILRRAGQEEKLFQVEKLEQYLLKETHTYTKELFNEKFVKPIEIAENALESKR
jgi:hypothetical protein